MKKIATFLAGVTLLGGGGVVVADEAANPYRDAGQVLEVTKDSVVEAAGKNQIELVKARPEVRLKKWDGEVDLGIRYDGVQAEGSRPLFTDRMEWKQGSKEVHAYPLAATPQMEDGGFEIEVVLNEAPASNRFDFEIDGAEELDFFYQSSSNDETTIRPDNVLGSYAVYHKEKKNHVEGETNYATGKAFHIFRPKAIDADGNVTWAEL
jgi:hypothetical protein